MHVRIEVRPDRRDRGDPATRQQVVQLLVDDLDAGAVGLGAGAGIGAQRALEVVHDRQQVLEHRRGRALAGLAALALDALAVVVELGRRAQQAIVELVTLLLERGERVVGCRRRGVGLAALSRCPRVGVGVRRDALGFVDHDGSYSTENTGRPARGLPPAGPAPSGQFELRSTRDTARAASSTTAMVLV